MISLEDYKGRKIRLSDERINHIENDHPEMKKQIDKIKETLIKPDVVVRSKSDYRVEILYKFYEFTPVNKKYMCILLKVIDNDYFIITSYFTDSIKKGEIIWERK